MIAPLEVAPDVFRFEKVTSIGWPLNMVAVRLPNGGLLVHSPTWLGEGTFEAVEALGRPEILFAPNAFHHLSLARFAARYQGALIVAGSAAIPRLAKKTGLSSIRSTSDAASALPPGARWLECAGTRSGETWLSLEGGGTRTWIVCDAFFHVTRPVTGAAGFLLSALKTFPGLCIGQTFRWLALRNVAAYRAAALEAIARDQPQRLIFSHGDAAEDDLLPDRLAALVRARL